MIENTNISSERESSGIERRNFPIEAPREESMAVQPNEATQNVEESPAISS